MSGRSKAQSFPIGSLRWIGVPLIALAWGLGHWISLAKDARSVSPAEEQAQPVNRDGWQLKHAGETVYRKIEELRVGDRVMAVNPQIDAAQRAERHEPNWQQWLHVSLELPLPAVDHHGFASSPPNSSATMKIELLRPETWLVEHMGYQAKSVQSQSQTWASGLPEREIFAEARRVQAWLDEHDVEVTGRFLQLDLQEMGAVGEANVIDIQACPTISDGTGEVVTATFQHPPSTQVLDVRFSTQSDDARCPDATTLPTSLAVGVTENHPFWSVDRRRFEPIGQMAIGDRVLTFGGQTQRIASMIPRAAPQSVYNLEVHGEHVYFVGEDGYLAHNNCELGDLGEKAAKGWLQRHNYSEIMQIQNRSGHGLDLVARHRDGTLTFFEVKTSSGGRAPGLSNAQSDQARFIKNKLSQAAKGSAWWRSTPDSVRQHSEKILEDLELGKKYRRYVIEITGATNGTQSTKFRIIPWSL